MFRDPVARSGRLRASGASDEPRRRSRRTLRAEAGKGRAPSARIGPEANDMTQWVRAVVVAALMLTAGTAHAATRLESIRARGAVTCAVTPRVAGFAQIDRSG